MAYSITVVHIRRRADQDETLVRNKFYVNAGHWKKDEATGNDKKRNAEHPEIKQRTAVAGPCAVQQQGHADISEVVLL